MTLLGRKRRRDERSNQHKGAQGKNKHADSPYPESSHARSPRKKRSLPAYMRDTEKENGRSSVGASLPSSSSTPTPGLLAFGEPDSLENLSNPFIVLDPFLMDPTNGALNLDSSAFIPETMPCFQQFPSFPFSVPQPDPTPFTLPSLSFPSFTSSPSTHEAHRPKTGNRKNAISLLWKVSLLRMQYKTWKMPALGYIAARSRLKTKMPFPTDFSYAR